MRSSDRHQVSSPTRRLIQTAAEGLFATNGIESVTTRDLAARAKVNVAAVNYHFGGKENLTLEIFRQVARRTADRRLHNLDTLEAAGSGPSLRAVIDSFVDAYLNEDDAQSGLLLARFVLKHRVEPSEWTRAVVADELDGMALRYIAALTRAAPYLDDGEVHWRYHLMVGAILMTLSDETTGARISRLSDGRCKPNDRMQFRARMVDFLVSAFGPTAKAPIPRPGDSA